MIFAAAAFAVAAQGIPDGPGGPDSTDESFHRAVESVQTRCFKCHSGTEVKGGLSLDSPAGWAHSLDMESPADSELIYRLELPDDDGDAMPPSGHRFDPGEIKALVDWIEAGASTADLDTALKTAAGRRNFEEVRFHLFREATGASVEYARMAGGALHRDHLVFSWSHQPTPPTAASLHALGPIATRVVEIQLAGTSVTDEMLANLPDLPILRIARLERTAVGDAGLASLIARAPALEILNVHSSSVTLASKALVATLPRLRHLTAFGTPLDEVLRTDPFAILAGRHGAYVVAADRTGLRLTVLEETSVGSFRPVRGVWPKGAMFRSVAPLTRPIVERLAAAGSLLIATDDGAKVREVRLLPESKLEWLPGGYSVRCVAPDKFVHWEGRPMSRAASR